MTRIRVPLARMNMPAMLRLMEMADLVIPFALHAALDLGIPEALEAGPRSAADLAAGRGLHAGALTRLLRALTSKDLLSEGPAATFALTDSGRLLSSDHPRTLRSRLGWDVGAVRDWAAAADDLFRSDWGFATACLRACRAAAESDPVARRILELADVALPTTIRAVSQLRIADLLGARPRTVPDLAAASGLRADNLQAALGGLVEVGIFTMADGDVVCNGPMAELMRTDRAHSLQGCLPLMSADLRSWAALEHTLRTGLPAFPAVHGQSYYEYLAERPEVSSRFDSSQQGATRLEVRAALRSYRWNELGDLVDVGGGNGTFLAGVLERNPTMHGVLFDLPFVVDLSADVLAAHGVQARCEVRGGSFFDDGAVPAGHDAYLIKRTLYNWDAPSAVRILTAVRRAMRDDSILLIFEPTRRVGDTFDVAMLTDMIMLVFTGGALRTIEELSTLLTEAGLELVRLVPTPMFPMLEIRAIPASKETLK